MYACTTTDVATSIDRRVATARRVARTESESRSTLLSSLSRLSPSLPPRNPPICSCNLFLFHLRFSSCLHHVALYFFIFLRFFPTFHPFIFFVFFKYYYSSILYNLFIYLCVCVLLCIFYQLHFLLLDVFFFFFFFFHKCALVRHVPKGFSHRTRHKSHSTLSSLFPCFSSPSLLISFRSRALSFDPGSLDPHLLPSHPLPSPADPAVLGTGAT